MKLYLKVILPIFTFALVYSFLSIYFGPKGVLALRQLTQERNQLMRHVQTLSDTGDALSIRIANLSSDPDTIAVYARELGYVNENERLIKLLHFSGSIEQHEDAGSLYQIQAPRFLSDTICKSIALLMCCIVLLCEMVIKVR